LLVRVQLGKRLTTNPTPNSTHGEVTNHVKLGGGRYRATTEVNVLSPEITIVSAADAFHVAAGNILITANQ
jgi:hypothetical protein